MIISNLDHLKTIVEAPSVVGGNSSYYYRSPLVEQPIYVLPADGHYLMAESYTESDDRKNYGFALSGTLDNGGVIAASSASSYRSYRPYKLAY